MLLQVMDSVTVSKQQADKTNPEHNTRFHPWSGATLVCLMVSPASPRGGGGRNRFHNTVKKKETKG